MEFPTFNLIRELKRGGFETKFDFSLKEGIDYLKGYPFMLSVYKNGICYGQIFKRYGSAPTYVKVGQPIPIWETDKIKSDRAIMEKAANIARQYCKNK